MKTTLLELLGIWGIADSIWLALNPSGWANFWGRWLTRIGTGGLLSRTVALAEFALSLLLLSGMSMRRGATQRLIAAGSFPFAETPAL